VLLEGFNNVLVDEQADPVNV